MTNPELLLQINQLTENGYKTPGWLYSLLPGIVLRATEFESFPALDTLMDERGMPIVNLLSRRTASHLGDLMVLYRGPIAKVKYQVVRQQRNIDMPPSNIEVTVVTNNFNSSRAIGKRYAAWYTTFD